MPGAASLDGELTAAVDSAVAAVGVSVEGGERRGTSSKMTNGAGMMRGVSVTNFPENQRGPAADAAVVVVVVAYDA